MQIKWGKHFSEPFHVTVGVREGLVLSPYFFAVYLDDLSTELINIKAGCFIGEVLLNHFILLTIIVCFAQVYEGCKVYLMCARLMHNRMELFSTAAKLFV